MLCRHPTWELSAVIPTNDAKQDGAGVCSKAKVYPNTAPAFPEFPFQEFPEVRGADSCWDTARVCVGGVQGRARWGGSLPGLGPSPPVAPLLSVIVLTEVEG